MTIGAVATMVGVASGDTRVGVITGEIKAGVATGDTVGGAKSLHPAIAARRSSHNHLMFRMTRPFV